MLPDKGGKWVAAIMGEISGRFPPSEPCACETCLAFCARPGWWAVEEAQRALGGGLGNRMMLEVAPERTFGVLSPAFKGCEGLIATNNYARNGCTFLENSKCSLHGSEFQPLECRFCHHTRQGQGVLCHGALEKDWARPHGRQLVRRWCKQTGFWDLLDAFGLPQLKK
jgi:hypothetical protein